MRNPKNDLCNDDRLIKTKGMITGEGQPATLPLGILETLQRPSNQIIIKNPDDTLSGVRYIVSTEPSTLRPIKSWTINIEEWRCKTMAEITSQDVLFIRLLNAPKESGYDHCVKCITARGEKMNIDSQTGFNAIMAAGVLINKIDAGRMPNIEKTLHTHKLIS